MPVTRTLLAVAALLALAGPVQAAEADDPGAAAAEVAPRDPHRWFYQSLSVLRLNPLGLITRAQLGYMYKLWGNPKIDPTASLGDKIKQDTYLKIAANTQLSPGFARPGIVVEAVPLALIRLSARVEQHTYWGAFNLITSFPSASAAHDEDTLDAAESYGTTGWSARIDARLQVKLGKIAVRSEVRMEYTSLDLEDGHPVFYEPILDNLVANNAWSMVKDTDLLYFVNDALIIGARYTYTKAFFDEGDFAPGEAMDANNAVLHRVGPAIIWQLDNQKTGTTFNQPTLFLITQFWLQHASRAGQEVTQAYPYTLLGFAFNGDL